MNGRIRKTAGRVLQFKCLEKLLKSAGSIKQGPEDVSRVVGEGV